MKLKNVAENTFAALYSCPNSQQHHVYMTACKW